MSLHSALEQAIKPILQDRAKVEMRKKAQEIYNGCKMAATSAIAQFYAAYTPIKYQRTHAFSSSPIVKLTKKNDMNYVVDIYFMYVGGHKDPVDYVYNGVIWLGYHGTSQIAVSTPPSEIMESYLMFNFS